MPEPETNVFAGPWPHAVAAQLAGAGYIRWEMVKRLHEHHPEALLDLANDTTAADWDAWIAALPEVAHSPPLKRGFGLQILSGDAPASESPEPTTPNRPPEDENDDQPRPAND